VARVRRAPRNAHAPLLDAIKENASPPLRHVDFRAVLDTLLAWTARQRPPLAERANADRTTLSYVIPENEVLLWRVAPRMKDGGKVELLPRSSALLPATLRKDFVRRLEALSPGTDLEPDRRFMIPLHNLLPPRSMKAFLAVLDDALAAARRLRDAASGAAGRGRGQRRGRLAPS
jgi:hypothetical protein